MAKTNPSDDARIRTTAKYQQKYNQIANDVATLRATNAATLAINQKAKT